MQRVGMVLTFVAVATAMLAGCSRGSPETGAQAVTLALNWVPEPQFGGFYAAQLGGAFERAGFDVTIRPGGAGAPTVQEVALGRVAFAVAAGDQVVMARQEGLDVVALFAVYQTSPRAIMVHRAKGFTQISQIFGAGEGAASGGRMTLALEPGLNFSDFLRARYGFERINVVPYAGGFERFLSEQDFGMQCFATSEPIEARRRGADPQVFLVADAGYNPYVAVLIARGDYVRNHREQVAAFVAAVREGWRAYLDDPEPANAVMHQLNPGMDRRTFTEAAQAQLPLIEDEFTLMHGLGAMSLERWQTLCRQLVELGVLKQAPPAQECFITLP